MRKGLQTIIQIIFLVAFVVLTITGRIQLWMAIFALGLIVSVFFSRLYCGWVCPINTLMRGISWLKKKLHIKSIKIPTLLKKPAVRYIVFGLFIALFVFTMATGKKLPVLPGLLIIGVVLTIFFPEELWHRYLCPYGTLFHIVSRKSIFSMNIDKSECTNCGICSRICPAAAVDKEAGYYMIYKDACLVCFACSDKCKQKAISYHQRPKGIPQTLRKDEHYGKEANG